MSIVYSKNTDWFKAVLYIAGVYHILWGISVIFFPHFLFDLAELSHPNYTQLWQYIGLYETIFGFGYLMAASNPLRHWRVVMLGFLTKLCVTLGFIFFYIKGEEPVVIFNMVLSNHIFWLIPFLIILYNAYRHQYLLDNEMIHLNSLDTSEMLDLYRTGKGDSLLELSEQQPVMLVFLRHFGCVFCRETLSYISKLRSDIESKGTKIVFVHMHENEKAFEELKKFRLEDIDEVSDSESMLYKGFQLKRGTLTQLFCAKVWIRGVYLWFTKGGLFGNSDGVDTFQMPGIFLVYKGEVIKKFIHQTPADIPPYLELATPGKIN